jgi:hypothetical protein
MGAKVIWNYLKGQIKWTHLYAKPSAQSSQGRRSICINSILSALAIEVSLGDVWF